jgi:glycosyltransferase involved in cell wall biosynthesis
MFRPTPGYFREVFQGVSWCDMVFGWWASWHMLEPIVYAKNFHKPVIVVGGDYDVIYEKQFRSSKRIFTDKFRKLLGYYIFPKIDQYITFSDFSKRQALKLPYVNPQRVCRIYCGLPDLAVNRNYNKGNLVISVGAINSYDIYRKGYATFVKSAALLPNFKFQMIGSLKDDSIELLRGWNKTNVVYPGYLPDKDLYQVMSDAKVYVQVSHHEGFGMALAEAMLFRCIPVVTNRGSIPEVVGDCGYYVPYGDPQKTADAIKEACEQSCDLGAKARERILSLFPMVNRKNQLFDIVEKTYSESQIG